MNCFSIRAPCRRCFALLMVLWALMGMGLRPSPRPAAEAETETESVRVIWMFEEGTAPAPLPPDPLEAAPESAVLHLLPDCLITHYDACVLCCGKSDGITASGERAVPGLTCAVDPAVIPLGSTVWVDCEDGSLRRYLAQDTGGGVTGRHIDLCVASHEEALQLGVRRASVYWSPPA